CTPCEDVTGRRVNGTLVLRRFGPLLMGTVIALLAPAPTAWPATLSLQLPPARAGAGMAYDIAAGQIVLFGGHNANGILGDTWTWDGTAWTRQRPAHAPSARFEMGMTYDAARGQVVLFGG